MNILASYLGICCVLGRALSDFPVSPCFVENQACDGQDIVETIIDVEDKETCRDICHGDPRCMFFTYYGENSFPLNKVCMILNACDSLYPCDGCYSEDSYCYRSCGDTVETQIGENLLSIVSNVNNSTECRFLCAETQNCSVYTFYNANHQGLPSTCFILQAFKSQFKRCENCFTSPVDCLGFSLCAFINEEDLPIPGSQIFTNASETRTLHTIRLGKCSSSLKILAVGGGGNRDCFSGGYCSYCSGGGSGNLRYTTVDVGNSVKISVSVGRGGEPTQVVLGEGSLAALADAGDGVNGYSGGGGAGLDCCCGHSSHPAGDGGCDGGDGTSGYNGGGGHGSSVDVASFQFERFHIR